MRSSCIDEGGPQIQPQVSLGETEKEKAHSAHRNQGHGKKEEKCGVVQIHPRGAVDFPFLMPLECGPDHTLLSDF